MSDQQNPGGEAPIGKRYSGGEWTVDRDEYAAYADATDDPNPAYRGADSVAPPMYHVRPFIDLMLGMANDPELEIDVLRLVHGEHTMSFHRPLAHGDVLELGGELLSVDVKGSGTVYRFALEGRVDGEVAVDGSTVYFVRGPDRASSGPKKERKPADEPPPPNWTHEQVVTEDQARRYAPASGDLNPIHTDEDVAKKAGLPRTILHGLCTLAFAARDLLDQYAEGDPARLASLSVRWARPVFPGDTLLLEVWDRGPTELAFRTLGPSGKPVLVNGRATLRGL